ncbi:MAG: hypothetical protein H7A45_00065, partial [Verrucomicrobiales bacterium]|nr:hypothetical protein [Verrucomicrobiales bacterium]MCP5525023.1 hypothetical protein [Verrucomicrobiales bacterium]
MSHSIRVTSLRRLPWLVAGLGLLAQAAEATLDFDTLANGYGFDGAHQAYADLGGGRGVLIQGVYGSQPEVFTPATPTASGDRALRNRPFSGNEFGSANDAVEFVLVGFSSDQVELAVGLSEHAASPVTATLRAGRRAGDVFVPLGIEDSLGLGSEPVGPTAANTLTVTSPTGAIGAFRVTYGSSAAPEVIDGIRIRVWEGDKPPPIEDLIPPVVHLTSPAPDTDEAPARNVTDSAVITVAGYIEENLGVTLIEARSGVVPSRGPATWNDWQPIVPIGVAPTIVFSAPLRLSATEGFHRVEIRATDVGGNLGTATSYIYYDVPRPPPPVLPENQNFVADGLEVLQVIQSGDHAHRLIANKPTAVRVYAHVETGVQVRGVDCSLMAYRGGEPLAERPLRALNRVRLSPGDHWLTQRWRGMDDDLYGARSDYTHGFDFVIPIEWTAPGHVEFVATVNPFNGVPEGDGMYNPRNNTGRDVVFHDTERHLNWRVYRLRVTVQHDDGTTTVFEEPSEEDALRQLRISGEGLYWLPLPGNRIHARFADVVDITLSASDPRDADGQAFVQLLGHIAANPPPPPDTPGPEFRVGLADTDLRLDEVGLHTATYLIDGYFSLATDFAPWMLRGLGMKPLVAEDDWRRNEFWLESFGRNAPFWEDLLRECNTDYPNYRAPSGILLPRGSIGEIGANPGGVGLNCGVHYKSPWTERDLLMEDVGLWGNRWIGRYTWDWLTDYFDAFDPAMSATVREQPIFRRAEPPVSEEYLHFSGWVRPGNVWMSRGARQFHPAGFSVQPGQGPYRLELYDAKGSATFKRHFELEATRDNEGFFHQALPVAGELAEAVLYHEDFVLARVTASPVTPSLAITVPKPGQTWPATGTVLVDWLGEDTKSDTLTYRIDYRPSPAATWQSLRQNALGRNATLNLADLPGGVQAEIRVVASDGLNETAAVVSPLIKGDLPPRVAIRTPGFMQVFGEGLPVLFQADVRDPESGELPAEDVRWLSDRDGLIGYGSCLSASQLSPGIHRVRVDARDGWAQRTSDEVTIVIAQDDDIDRDQLPNELEAQTCTSVEDPDSDDDGILDGVEDANANGHLDPGETDPCDDDTDGDGLPDGWEVRFGLDPTDAKDALSDGDKDGHNALAEFKAGTDPTVTGSAPGLLLPDLLPLELETDDWLPTGVPFAFGYRAGNAGESVAGQPWEDHLYLSDDPELSGDDLRLASWTIKTDLPANQAYTQEAEPKLPGLEDGAYFLLLVTDAGAKSSVAEVNESNNLRARLVEVIGPDLEPSDLEVPPEAAVGNAIPAEWTVRNQGRAGAQAWFDLLYLSEDDLLDPGDVLLWTAPGESVLAPTEEVRRRCAVTLP